MGTDTDTERLDEANACHDDDPPRGAELLRGIAAAQLPPDRWPGFSFLLNHVLGEKLGCWHEALQRQRALLAVAQPAPALVLRRQAATAARLASAGTTGPMLNEAREVAAELAAAFAQASGASLERSNELLQLNAVMYQLPALASKQAAGPALAALVPFASPAWQAASALDASAAACLNNVASGLLERPAADLQHPALREALVQSAELALRVWQRAGTWVQHERALYLRAMVSNALGEHREARAHAQAALALLNEHDAAHAEDVDRAFVELERWWACSRSRLAAEAADARTNADALAAEFKDAGLTAWFERREQALRAGAQR